MGDSNVDGVGSTPLRGDWGRLRFNSGSSGALDEIDFRWGGGGDNGSCCAADKASDGTLSISNSSAPSIDNLLIEQSRSRGVYLNVTGGFTTTLANSVFQSNTLVGGWPWKPSLPLALRLCGRRRS